MPYPPDSDRADSDLTDSERAGFIGAANIVGIGFTVFFYALAKSVASPYYNPSLFTAHLSVVAFLFVLSAFFWSLNSVSAIQRAIFKMAHKNPKERGDVESFGWVLPVGISIDFVAMGVLVGLTGGTIESLFSPYILTMVVIGQFLTSRTSVKITLGLGAGLIYALVLSPELLLSALHVTGGVFVGQAFGVMWLRWIYFSVLVVSVGIATVLSILSVQKREETQRKVEGAALAKEAAPDDKAR